MGQQIAYRLLLSIPVLCGVLMLGFLLIKLAPGDPAMVIAGPSATPDVVERIREEMGSTSRRSCSSGATRPGSRRAISADR